MNADYAVVRDLAILNEPYIKGRRFCVLWCLAVVLFGIAAWLLFNYWLIVALYIHCEWLNIYY